MKAIALTERTEDGEFKLIDCQAPECPRGHVLVRNHFAGVNKGDGIRRLRGLFPPDAAPPYILGFEGSGEVVEVGDDVRGFQRGDDVGYLVPGGAFAELIAVPSHAVFRKPVGVTQEVLASTSCIGLTAIGLLERVDNVDSKSVLIHGGTGSVGSTLAHICKSRGIQTYATVSTEEQRGQTCLPWERVVALDNAEAGAEIKEMTMNEGIDVVFDCIGQAALDINLQVLKPHGDWLYYGSASGHASFPGLEVLMKSLRISGFVIFDCINPDAKWERMKSSYLSLLETGTVSPKVSVITPSETTEHFRKMDKRLVAGRYIIDMRHFG